MTKKKLNKNKGMINFSSFGNIPFNASLNKNQSAVKVETIFFNKLIHNNFVNIPVFQREYAWTKTLIKKFVKDFVDNLHTITHLGEVVLSQIDNENEYLEVIDGQQRITTLSLVLACSRDLIHYYASLDEYNDEKEHLEQYARQIQNLLTPSDPNTGKYSSFLKSDQLGANIVGKILETTSISDEELESIESKDNNWDNRVIAAYRTIYSYLKEQKVEIVGLANKILYGTTLTRAIYEDAISATNAFIKINTTQEPLTFENMLKVFIYSQPNGTELLTKWKTLKSKFKTQKDVEDYILNYLKAFMNNGDSFTKSNTLEKFGQLVGNKELDVSNFITHLFVKLEDYLTFIYQYDYNKYTSESLINFEIFRSLGFNTHLPLLLIASELKKENQFLDIVNQAKMVYIQKQSILGQDARSVTGTINNVIKYLRGIYPNRKYDFVLKKGQNEDINEFFNKKQTNPLALEQGIKELLSKDFKTDKDRKKARGLYLLLEQHLSTQEKKIDFKVLDIDHFFPTNLEKKLDKLKEVSTSKQEFSTLVNKLANQRPFLKTPNRSHKDALPVEKIVDYQNSQLNINNTLFSNEISIFKTYLAETNANLYTYFLEILNINELLINKEEKAA